MNIKTKMRKRYILSHVLCLCLLGFAGITNILAATYYVAINGNNANSGSQQSPWLTIQYAANRVSAGDTVRVSNGTYNEVVTIGADGTSSNWINFIANTNGGPVILRRFTFSSANYVRVIGFEITHINTSQTGRGIEINGMSSHIEIIDNYIHHTQFDIIQAAGIPTYITIRGNRLDYAGNRGGSLMESMNAIANTSVTPHHWLAEYNHMTRFCDGMDLYGTNIVARNNWMYNIDASYWSSVGHPDFFQPGSDGAAVGTRHQLYERNWTGMSSNAHSHFGIWQDTVNAGDSNIVIRGNVMFRTGAGAGAISTDKFRVLNNSAYDQCADADGSGLFISSRTPAVEIICANNVAQDDNGAGRYAFYVDSGQTGLVTHNWGYQLGSSYSGILGTSNPLFTSVSYSNPDLRLQSGSPIRGVGTNLIRITSAPGSGTSFVVNDSQLLSDGWDMVEGDVILVGSTRARITDIDWSTHRVTVASSVSWTQNTPVYWGDRGDQRDLGAYPHGASFLTAATLSQNGTTYTVAPTGDARGVWFYVDGIPTIWDYDAPFTATIPSGTVTAKAYALWAQHNPVVTAGLGGPAPLSPPSIVLQPTNQTNMAGQSVTFTVAANGNPAPSYTWQTNNGSGAFVNVASGGNSPSWSTPALALGHNGWRVRVALTNSQGYLLSDTVYIGVTSGAAPVISVQPQNATTAAGGAANFTVVASGGALSYQWRLGGAAIPGATTSVYITNNVTLAANGNQYSVVVVNGWGAITSQVATLTVNNTGNNVWHIGNTWTTFGLANANDHVQFSFDAYVSNPDADFGIGFSPNVVDAWNDLGPIVLFDVTGVIYARNAGVYMADTTIAYLPNTWYHISGTANILTRTYSISVNGTPIATNYAFRSQQAGATQLSNFGATEGYSSVAVVSNLVWTPYLGNNVPRPAPPTNLRAQ